MLKQLNYTRNCANCPHFSPRLDLRPMRSTEGKRGVCKLTEQVVRAHWLATAACK